MPVVDAPGDRATLALDVVLPAGVKAIGNGRALRVRPLDRDRVLHRWRQEVPVPSYTFGFAAGRFTRVDVRARGPQLSYLGDGFSEDELRRVFADTADMLDWFAQRAGVRYPAARYSQALVAETGGQELAGFALLSEAHGRRVLADPSDQSLIAHETAHQWWGNGVTCANWNHFWLNEGFATFMAAAYLQHRFGDEAYRRQVDGWHKRLERLRSEGKDRPLVFPDWNKPSSDDRAVVYQKGAYVLHLLREHLGERAFWRGMHAYTRANFGRAVVTPDFQAAMERASGQPLTKFFQQWVYAAPRDPSPLPVGSQR
jgi:aminopeptidase N